MYFGYIPNAVVVSFILSVCLNYLNYMLCVFTLKTLSFGKRKKIYEEKICIKKRQQDKNLIKKSVQEYFKYRICFQVVTSNNSL